MQWFLIFNNFQIYILRLLLLRAKTTFSQPVDDNLKKSLKYIKSSFENLEPVDTYTLVLSLYAFKLDSQDIIMIEEIETELNKELKIRKKSCVL